MSKYASLLFSPDKYHEIGPFRFPIYNDLVPGEAKCIEEASRQQSKSTYNSIKLAQRIAKDKGITTKEAVDLLSNAAEDNEQLLYDYAADLEELQASGMSAVAQQVAFVTVFMQYRGEAKLPDSQEWQKLSDWTEADTEAIPGRMVKQIFDLITWERDGWPSPEGNVQEEEPKPAPRRSKR